MKTRAIVLLGLVAVSGLAMTAFGQFGQPVRARDILGDSIKGAKDQKLGTVEDLAVDLDNGRIVEVIVARGGFLGAGRKRIAVPPNDFALVNDGKILRLTLSVDRLNNAPQIDFSKWTDSVAEFRVEEVYQYFDVTPYFLVPEHQAHKAGRETFQHLGAVERASSLLDMKAVDRQGEKIGKIENLYLDFSEGRVIEVTIESGHYMGMHGELSAVPPQALHFDPDRIDLRLDTSKEEMIKAPHFSRDARPEMNRYQATDVYQAYHVVPYFLPIGFSSSAPAAPANANEDDLKPLQQGTSNSDMKITAKIEKEIQDTEGLSADAKSVKVITIDGRVTLRGTVDNSEEKNRVAEIAARVVPTEKVDNRLVVKNPGARAGN